VLDGQLAEGKVARVARGQARAGRESRGRDEAVALAQGDSPSRILAAPPPRADSLRAAERRHPEAPHQTIGRVLLIRPQSAHQFLDVDRASKRYLVLALEFDQPRANGGCPTERVDENSRVEQDRHASAETPGVSVSLRLDPSRRIVVPLVTRSWNRPDGRLDERPTFLTLESCAYGRFDEPAASTAADPLIESCHEVPVEMDVDTHVAHFSPLLNTKLGPKGTGPDEA
jgi:hypothetical protein